MALTFMVQVSIARGHPRTAITSYKSTLKQTKFDDKEYNVGLHLPNPSFTLLRIEDVVQLCHRADSRTSIDISIMSCVSEDDEVGKSNDVDEAQLWPHKDESMATECVKSIELT